MDASLHSQARGSFRRRPILAGSGCFGKDRYPLRILEIARTAERAEEPPELCLSAPGLDGGARPPAPAGSAFRGAAGFGSVFERLTSFEELAAAWNAVLAEDILDQQLRRQAKEIGPISPSFSAGSPPNSEPGCTSRARSIRSSAKGSARCAEV